MAVDTRIDDILLEEHPAQGVVLVRLNRTGVLNSLNLALRQALAATFVRLDADPAVKVIILAGSERAFCAGADLNEYVDATPPEIIARNMDRLWGAISGCSKPVIAAVRGHALGGGCELAMHADIIVAGEGARFGQPEVEDLGFSFIGSFYVLGLEVAMDDAMLVGEVHGPCKDFQKPCRLA